MSSVNHHRIVVRRKVVQGGGGHHGGSWKIAYADFITAMFALFLVLWLLSIVPRDDLKGLAEYFQMPLRVAMMGGPSSSVTSGAIPGGGADPLRDDGEVRRAQGARLQAQAAAERQDRRRLQNLRQKLEALIETNPVLKNFRPQLLIDMTMEGLRIQIVDNQNRPMFAVGRAQVQPYMRDILRELGPALNDLPNRISISGHTDAAQYALGEKAYSNWELSADRANASRQELVAGGMQELKIMRIMGLAASMSLVKDDPYAAVNRRISLVVLNERTQRRIEAENAAASQAVSGELENPEVLVPLKSSPLSGSMPESLPGSLTAPLSGSPPGSLTVPLPESLPGSLTVPPPESPPESLTSAPPTSAQLIPVLVTPALSDMLIVPKQGDTPTPAAGQPPIQRK